ncbi:MAG: hypothetical protein ACKO81_12785 [Planctomycetota bacterium]
MTERLADMKWHLTLLLVLVAFFVGLIWFSYEIAMRYDLYFAFKQHRRNVFYCATAFSVLSILVARHAKLSLRLPFLAVVLGFLLYMARISFVIAVESDQSIRQELHLNPYYDSWKWYEAFLILSMVQILGFVIAFYQRLGTARGAERSRQ